MESIENPAKIKQSTTDGFMERKRPTIKPIPRKFIQEDCQSYGEGDTGIDPKDVLSKRRRLFSDTPENYAVYFDSARLREGKKGNFSSSFIRGALSTEEKIEFFSLYSDGRNNGRNQQKIYTDMMNIGSLIFSIGLQYGAVSYVQKGDFWSPVLNTTKIKQAKRDAQAGKRFEVPQATTGLVEYAKKYWSVVSDPEECARKGLATKCANTNKGSIMASRERLKQMGCINYTTSDIGFEPGVKQSETLVYDIDLERLLAVYEWLYSLSERCQLPFHFGMFGIWVYKALVSRFFNCKTQISEWMQETGKKIYEASFEIREVYGLAPPEPEPWVYV